MRIGPFDGATAADIEATLRARGAAWLRVSPGEGLGVHFEVDPKALRDDPELRETFAPRLGEIPPGDEFRCLDCDREAPAPGTCPSCHDDSVVDFRGWVVHRRALHDVRKARPHTFGLLLAVATVLVGAVLFLGKPGAGTGRRPTSMEELFRGTGVLEGLDRAEIRAVSSKDGRVSLGPARELSAADREKVRELLQSKDGFHFARCPPNVRCDADALPLQADVALRLAADDHASEQPLLLVARDRSRIGVLFDYDLDGSELRPRHPPVVVGVQAVQELAALVSP